MHDVTCWKKLNCFYLIRCRKRGKENRKQKSKLAVKSVSFGVPNGQVFGLLGPNGAGKTTTMKMITAEENPSRGYIKIGPHEIKSNDSEGFEYLGYCPQVRSSPGSIREELLAHFSIPFWLHVLIGHLI